MKKTAFSLFAFLLTSSLIVNPSFAETEETQVPSDVLEQVEEITSESEFFDLISLDELPEEVPVVHFDTLEDFEKALKELDEEQQRNSEAIEAIEIVEPEEISLSPVEQKTSKFSVQSEYVTTAATSTTTTTRYRAGWKPTWNPILTQVRPLYVTVDMKHTYTGSGSTKKFTRINSIKSYSPLSFPADWRQTAYNTSFYNSNKNVTVQLLGYHLLGVSIGGQSIGARVSDTLNYKYPIGGASTVIAYK